MLMTWLLLLASLAIILVGCDLFTNGVEWAGRKLRLSEGAVGSVLAAVGTCLPETLIAILAIVFGRSAGAGEVSGEGVGVGAILGAPMMLSTLAFFVTGAAVLGFAALGRRSTNISVNAHVLGRDLRFFFLVFALSAAASYLPDRSLKILAGLLLIGFYVAYVRQTFAEQDGVDNDEELSPLHLHRLFGSGEPPFWLVIAQSVAGLAVIVLGAHLFVDNLTAAAVALNIQPLVLSLVLTPVATELPEKFNSILWVRQRKDTLALGNISGAMVFQSSIPTAIGLFLTRWELDPPALAAVVVALVSTGVVWAEMTVRRRVSAYSLLLGGAFYGGYLAWLFAR